MPTREIGSQENSTRGLVPPCNRRRGHTDLSRAAEDESLLRKALSLNYNAFGEAMFEQRRPGGEKRQRVKEEEIKAYIDEIIPFLENVSGSRIDTYYTWDTQDELMIKLYSVWQSIVRRAAHGEVVLKEPRTKATVFRRIMNRLSLVKRGKPKVCHYCDEHREAKDLWDSTLRRLQDCEDPVQCEHYRSILAPLKRTMEVGLEHQVRDQHQRSKSQHLRLNLLKTESAWWRDFGSWGRPGNQCNDLTIVIEFKDDDGLLQREFVDFPSNDSSHDIHFLAQCMNYLFEKTNHIIIHHEDGTHTPRFQTNYSLGDNGNPFMSHPACYMESELSEKWGVDIQSIPLCPLHASSIADAHLGVLKPIVKTLIGRSSSGGSLDQSKRVLEQTMKQTFVYPQKVTLSHLSTTPSRSLPLPRAVLFTRPLLCRLSTETS
jgi:hypothetical protein